MPSSHPIICHPFFLHPIPPASESFPMSQLFTWGFQSTGVSASASFPPKKSQGSDAYLHSCSWSPRIIESQDQAVFFERSRKQKQKCMGRSYLLFIFVCVFECIEGEILMCVCVCVFPGAKWINSFSLPIWYPPILYCCFPAINLPIDPCAFLIN